MLLRGLVFWLAFILDVHVKAAFLQHPKHCWDRQQSPCVMEAQKNRDRLSLKKEQLVFLKGSSVMFEGEKVRLLKGAFYILAEESGGPVQFVHEFGKFKVAGEALVKKSLKDVQVAVLRGHVTYWLRGKERKFYRLPKGFSIQWTSVTRQGVAQASFPGVIDVRTWIPLWAQLFPKDRSLFYQKLNAFRIEWRKAATLSQYLAQGTVDRLLAEARERRRREQLKRKWMQEQNRFFKELFRKKNYILDNF
ncbi:MAG: hypothetical protein D6797_03345 [Bdellovibrio sp.]|nr:MAG: hypothetical protein D6797_03345 [Bdellovibrio sp.]